MEYFGRCYAICSQLDNAAALYSARVQYGIAKGHQFMGDFSSHVTDLSSGSLQHLVAWKDARVVKAVEQEEVEEAEEEMERGEEITGTGVGSGEENEDQDEEREEGRSSEEELVEEGGEKEEMEERTEEVKDGQGNDAGGGGSPESTKQMSPSST